MDNDQAEEIVKSTVDKATYMIQCIIDKECLSDEKIREKYKIEELLWNCLFNIAGSIIGALFLVDNRIEYIDYMEKLLIKTIQNLTQERRKEIN